MTQIDVDVLLLRATDEAADLIDERYALGQRAGAEIRRDHVVEAASVLDTAGRVELPGRDLHRHAGEPSIGRATERTVALALTGRRCTLMPRSGRVWAPLHRANVRCPGRAAGASLIVYSNPKPASTISD